MTFFREYNMSVFVFLLTVSGNHGNPIILIYRERYTKSLNYVLNQNVNVTKRAQFATVRYMYLRQFMLTTAL